MIMDCECMWNDLYNAMVAFEFWSIWIFLEIFGWRSWRSSSCSCCSLFPADSPTSSWFGNVFNPYATLIRCLRVLVRVSAWFVHIFATHCPPFSLIGLCVVDCATCILTAMSINETAAFHLVWAPHLNCSSIRTLAPAFLHFASSIFLHMFICYASCFFLFFLIFINS